MNTEELKICSVTGHRPGGFPWNYENKECNEHKEYLQTMAQTIEDLITEGKYNYFIAGGAIGVDTDFAETVIFLRDTKYPYIKLEIAVPCENQDLKWSQQDKDKYRQILSQADVVKVLSKRYTRFCMHKRNEYMVNKSNVVLAFWNVRISKGGTYSTIRYMERKKINFEIIDLLDFLEEYKKVDALLRGIVNSMSQEELHQSWEQFKKRMIDEGRWPLDTKENEDIIE